MITINNYSSGNWDNITLNPYVAATPWYITMPSGTAVSGVTVSYSNASSGYAVYALTSSGNIDGGNNVNWVFSTSTPSGVDYLHTVNIIDFSGVSVLVYTGASHSPVLGYVEFETYDNTFSTNIDVLHYPDYIDFVLPSVEVMARVLYCSGDLYTYPIRTSGGYNTIIRISGNYTPPSRVSGSYNYPTRTTACRFRFT